MYKVLIFLAFILSCKHQSAKQEIKRNKESNSYFTNFLNDSTQEYFEYLGQMNISGKEYNVSNLFMRFKGPQVWRGQSILLFCNINDTASYILDSNEDFPNYIMNNEFNFSQKKISYKVDSLSKILCLPTGCVERQRLTQMQYSYNQDSIKEIFRGGYPPEGFK